MPFGVALLNVLLHDLVEDAFGFEDEFDSIAVCSLSVHVGRDVVGDCFYL